MSDFPIESETRHRQYSSEEHGEAKISVVVHDFYPCVDSWTYRPPEEYEGLTGDTRMMPAEFHGKDLLHCNVWFQSENTKQCNFVSLRRGIRSSTLYDNEVAYESSALTRSSQGVYVKTDGENRVDYHKGDTDMIWELVSSEPFTLDDQLDMLADEAHRMFDPNVPTQI